MAVDELCFFNVVVVYLNNTTQFQKLPLLLWKCRNFIKLMLAVA